MIKKVSMQKLSATNYRSIDPNFNLLRAVVKSTEQEAILQIFFPPKNDGRKENTLDR